MEEEVIKDAVLEILSRELYTMYDTVQGEQEAADKIAKYIHSLLKTK